MCQLLISIRVSRPCSCVESKPESQLTSQSGSKLPTRIPARPAWSSGLWVWLAGVFIHWDWVATEDRLSTHASQSLVKVCFFSFPHGTKSDDWKNYPLQQEEKQTINHHLIYVECLHRVLHAVIINHLVGRWRYYHSSTEEEREMQRVWNLHMITQLASGHEEFWPLAICL